MVLSTFIGVAFPTFQSIKALESEGTDDDKQWLTYWAIFGLFTVVDDITHTFLGLLPFYYLAKVLFLIYLFFPTTKGAIVIYNKVVLPLYKKHGEKIKEQV